MLIISRQRRNNLQNPNLSLRYNEIDIKMTTVNKILGVQVDENLFWNNQLLHVSKKVSFYLWLLSKIRQYLSIEHRLLFYNAYIKPHLKYCITVWFNTSYSNISTINTLQRRACKLILSQTYHGLHETFQRLNILSFDQSVFLNKAKIMCKIYNNLAPTYLQELLQMPDVNLANTSTNLRSVTHKHYLLPQPKCNLFKGSLSYSGIVVWNSISINIKIQKSLDIFIKKCTDWIKG